MDTLEPKVQTLDEYQGRDKGKPRAWETLSQRSHTTNIAQNNSDAQK